MSDATEALWTVGTALVSGGIGWGARSSVEVLRKRRPLRMLLDEDHRVIYRNTPPWVSFPYFFECSAAEVPAPPPGGPLEWWVWARRHGGTPADVSESQLTISSRTSTPLVVDGLNVVLNNSNPANEGVVVFQPVGGADITHRGFEVRLNTFCPTVSVRDHGGSTVPQLDFSLSRGESARFSITAFADRAENTVFDWSASVQLVVDGRRKFLDLKGSRESFLLYAGNAPRYSWDGDRWVQAAG